MAFSKGDYVRVKQAPDTRMGTIEGTEEKRGHTFYIFHQDPRYSEAGREFVASFLDDELEPCARPSDDYWREVNAAIKRRGG